MKTLSQLKMAFISRLLYAPATGTSTAVYSNMDIILLSFTTFHPRHPKGRASVQVILVVEKQGEAADTIVDYVIWPRCAPYQAHHEVSDGLQCVLSLKHNNNTYDNASHDRRIAKDNVKPLGRQIGKLCHTCPGVVFELVGGVV